MTSEPKIEAVKSTSRIPALVRLAQKRRFKANPSVQEEGADLKEESQPTPPRQKLKRTGRVVLRWPSKSTSIAQIASAPVNIRSYAP
jgi:hypothetical protein